MDYTWLCRMYVHTCALELYIEVAGEVIHTIECIFCTQYIQTYGEQRWWDCTGKQSRQLNASAQFFIDTLGSITGRVPMEQPEFRRDAQRHNGHAPGAPLFRVWSFSLPALRRNELNPFVLKLWELNAKCTMNALYRISRPSCLHEFI